MGHGTFGKWLTIQQHVSGIELCASSLAQRCKGMLGLLDSKHISCCSYGNRVLIG
jgi:hypothetical protein